MSTHPPSPIRWGIVGTANIARGQFLPALRAAGGGTPALVASREAERAAAWAAEHGVERGIAGYQQLVESPEIDAVYVALPDDQHARWAIASLEAGKAVLCEKPLCVSEAEVTSVLEAAAHSGSPLWEAFVFPWQRQFARLQKLLTEGAIGEVREIQSNFYFRLRHRDNIRLRPEMYGGAVNDVGCYPLRLAQLLFQADPERVAGLATWAPEGVDEETQAVVQYPGERRLVFACGLTRPYDTFTRVLGTEGEIRLSNPFHPGATDTLEVRRTGVETVEHLVGSEPSFTAALRHIHAAVRGEEAPRHTAAEESPGTARALALVHEALSRP